jgi:hypothetical protein
VRSLKTGLVAALTGMALVVTSLPAFGANVSTASFYSPPAGEAPSPGLSVETTLVSKPAGSNINRAYIDIVSGSERWDPAGGLGENCTSPKNNPSQQDLANCGISSVELLVSGETTYRTVTLTTFEVSQANKLFDFTWDPNGFIAILAGSGAKLRVVFLPGAFTTKSGTGYQVRTQLLYWCTTSATGLCFNQVNRNGLIEPASLSSPFDVLPLALPPAPLAPTVEAGDSRATVTPVPDPASAGVTSFTVTANTGETCTVEFPDVSCEVTGLTNGTQYTFTTTATNGAGTSPSSPASTCVVPNAAGGVTTCGSGATEGSTGGNTAGTSSGTGGGKENKRPSQAVAAADVEPVAMAGDTLARTGVNPAQSILLATVAFSLVALGGLATYARRTLK